MGQSPPRGIGAGEICRACLRTVFSTVGRRRGAFQSSASDRKPRCRARARCQLQGQAGEPPAVAEAALAEVESNWRLALQLERSEVEEVHRTEIETLRSELNVLREELPPRDTLVNNKPPEYMSLIRRPIAPCKTRFSRKIKLVLREISTDSTPDDLFQTTSVSATEAAAVLKCLIGTGSFGRSGLSSTPSMGWRPSR